MLCITHWTSRSSSLLSGIIKIFTCFRNETKVHWHLLAMRGGIGCIPLPFGWGCPTKSSHTGHGSIVKSFTQKGDLGLLQCSSGYMTFSKSCKDRMILSSWKQGEDISMKPAWTSTILNSALAPGSSAAAPAGSSLALGMLPPLWAGSVPRPDSAQQLAHALALGLPGGRASTGSSPEPASQHRLCHAGHWAAACAQPSDVPGPGCANVPLANVLHKSKWNGRFWSDKRTALREHFLPEIPAQTKNTCDLCNLSLSEVPRAKWESYRQTQGKSWIISPKVLEFYFKVRTRFVFKNIMMIFHPQEFSHSKSQNSCLPVTWK